MATLEQQQAIAVAQAKRRRAEAEAAGIQPRTKVGLVEDVGRGTAAGLFQGGLDLLSTIVNPGGSMMLDTTAGMQNTIEDLTGRDVYEAESKLGKVAQAGGRGVAGGAAGGGAGGVAKMGLNALRYGTLPMVAQEVAGQATEGSKWEPVARLAAGLGTGGVAAGLSRAAGGARVAAPKPPPGKKLLEVGGKEYKVQRQLDTRYDPNAVADIAQNLKYRLFDEGMGPDDAPRIYRVLNKLSKPPTAKPGETSFISITDLDRARRKLRVAIKNSRDDSDAAAGPIVIDEINKFVESADPATVISGPAELTASLNRNARGNWAAGKQSQKLTNIDASAELRDQLGFTGQPLENRLRTHATNIVDPLKPKLREGFKPGELELLKGVSEGTNTRTALREAGRFISEKGIVPALAGGTALTAGMPILAIPAAVATALTGGGLRRAATGLTQRAFREVDEAVRSRAPYAEHLRSQTLPAKVLSPEGRAALGQVSVAKALSDDKQRDLPVPIDPRIEAILRALMPPQ